MFNCVILPDEFLLKNNMVALMTAFNIFLCKFIETLIKNNTIVAFLMRIVIIIETVKTTYTETQTCRKFDKFIIEFNELSVTNVPL